MQPIFFTVGTGLPVMIIPHPQAHVNGHPVLTYTYSIYKDTAAVGRKLTDIISTLHLTKNNNPNYMSTITFEQPGKLFTYTAGQHELDSNEVQEIIETISYYRDDPAKWQI